MPERRGGVLLRERHQPGVRLLRTGNLVWEHGLLHDISDIFGNRFSLSNAPVGYLHLVFLICFLAGFLVDRSQAFWLERLFAKRLAFYTTTQLIWLLGEFIAVATSCKVFSFSKFGRRQKDPDVTKQTAKANSFIF